MGDVLIEGRSSERATLLLAAAEDLEQDASVVRTTSGGYLVPDDVAKAAGLGDDVAKAAGLGDGEEPAKKAAKKAPAKKTTARKTAAKKTTAKKAAAKAESKPEGQE